MNIVAAHSTLITFAIGLAITFAIGTAIGMVDHNEAFTSLRTKHMMFKLNNVGR